MSDWTIKQGDTGYVIRAQLRDAREEGQRYGPVVDLTGIESAHVLVWITETPAPQALIFNADIEGDPVDGHLCWRVTKEVAEIKGQHRVEWVVNEAGAQRTYPATSRRPFQYLLVRADVRATTA